jgi:hypothetical protein
LASGVAISIVFLYATLATVPISSVLNALAGAQPNWIVASLGFIFLAYVHEDLSLDLDAPHARRAYHRGAGGNAVRRWRRIQQRTPVRAGDVIRVIAFNASPRPAVGQLGTLLLERLLDLFVLMIFLFATVSFWRITAIDASVLAGARWGRWRSRFRSCCSWRRRARSGRRGLGGRPLAAAAWRR